MEKITASAPSRLFVCGEHFIVYGAPALAVPVEIRNEVSIEEGEGELRVEIESRLGNASVLPDGSMLGSNSMKPYAQVAARVLKQAPLKDPLIAFFEINSPRGLGSSTSLSLAFAAALYDALGKSASDAELFACAQEADRAAHGKQPSGIDAKAILEGPQEVVKRFEPPGFMFAEADVALPKGHCFLFVDTAKGEWSTKTGMYGKFAKSVAGGKRPDELGAGERRKISAPYKEVFEKIKRQMRADGDAAALGAALRENHGLLKAGGVSSPEIEEAIGIAKGDGSVGEKVSGKGGIGGGVLVLAEEKKSGKIRKALEAEFRVFKAGISRGGIELR